MRYFFISYSYIINNGTGFGFSDLILNVDNDNIFNIVDLKNQLIKSNKYQSVSILSFQELNKNDYEKMKKDILDNEDS